ncbi:hypothetical protein AbraIFM66950_003466 [Aspergillus brasiliensis]|nr:hypothetical protein AbraIFM66950_003466 [Aspergillus brasiliensis]
MSSSSTTSTTTSTSPTTPQLPTQPHTLLFPSAHHETTELLQTLTHIRTHLHRAEHLYTQKSVFLDISERKWIETTIADTADAVHALAVVVEPVRVEWEVRNQHKYTQYRDGNKEARRKGKRMTMGLGTQLRWVCRDGQRAKVQRGRLMVCYSSLMVVLERLMGLNCDEGGSVGRGDGVMELGEVEVEVQELSGEGEVSSCGSGGAGGEAGLGMKGIEGRGLGSDVGDEMRDLLRWRQAKGNGV